MAKRKTVWECTGGDCDYGGCHDTAEGADSCTESQMRERAFQRALKISRAAKDEADDLLALAKEQTAWINQALQTGVLDRDKAVDLLARCQGLLNVIEPE